MKMSSDILFLFFFVYFLLVLPDAGMPRAEGRNLNTTAVEFHVGVILDMETWVGKISHSCISMALADFYAAHANYSTRLVLHPRDSKMDIVGAASAAMDLLENFEVKAIIGPQRSVHAKFIIDLGDKAQVPIISFSATSPSLRSQSPYFIQVTPGDHTQVKAIASIAQTFGWRKVILIHEDTDYGNQLIPYLIQGFQEVYTQVPYRSAIPPTATNDQILKKLFKLMTMKTSIFVVHMSSSLGSRLFLKAKEVGMMSEGYAWIITNGVTNEVEFLNSSVLDSMQGVLGVNSHLPQSEGLNNFTERWKGKFLEESREIKTARLINFGLWAYDTVWALAMAIERVRDTKSHILKPVSDGNSTDILTFSVSRTGPELLEEILKIEFKGLSGDFHLVNGQLRSPAFQILNVIGKRSREVGFWTPTHGISRDLNLDSENSYSASKANFQSIIWPGGSTTVPIGWVIPVSGEKLRIGVPVRNSFTEFVKVERDTHTNSTIVRGYCIDVFNSVIASLPYTIPYEFVPFQKADGKSAGNYNELIDQVFFQKYDAVIGDTTITANRSLYVDFALPYTDGGVWMIVPIKSEQRKITWIFFNNLKDFWLSSGAFIIFMTFVIWLLEQRGSKIFNDQTSQHLSRTFHLTLPITRAGEKLARIFFRLVVIQCLFIVFIIISFYTASSTSMLKANRFQPTVTDFKDLISNGDYVGYRKGSFVRELLKRSNFDESRLKAYNTPEEYNEALLRGSQNDGIAAFFDELPYINIFLSKYCSKYTIVGPTHRTDGFGFVFPRGSPMVVDFSKAILNVTEGKKMMEIKRAWFGHKTACHNDNHEITHNPVIITSIVSILLLVLSDILSKA